MKYPNISIDPCTTYTSMRWSYYHLTHCYPEAWSIPFLTCTGRIIVVVSGVKICVFFSSRRGKWDTPWECGNLSFWLNIFGRFFFRLLTMWLRSPRDMSAMMAGTWFLGGAVDRHQKSQVRKTRNTQICTVAFFENCSWLLKGTDNCQPLESCWTSKRSSDDMLC